MQFRPSPSQPNRGAWTFPKDKKLDYRVVSDDHACVDCNKPIKLRLISQKTITPTRCYKCDRKARGLPPRVKKKPLPEEGSTLH